MSGALQAVFQNMRATAAPAFLANLYQATGGSVATDSSSNVYAYVRSPATGNGVIGKYDRSGALQSQTQITRANGGNNRTAADSSGNVVTVFGSGTTLSVVKSNSAGTILWQTEMYGWPSGCSGVSVSAAGVCFDSAGNVYICAPVYTACVYAFAVIKLNSSGTLQFSRQVTASFGFRADFPCNIAVDSAGGIYFAADRSGCYQVATLVKLDSTGALSWGRSILSPGGNSALSDIAIDSSDNVYAVGSYSVPPVQAYLVKYNSAGTLQWNRSFGISIATTATGIGLDSSGNIYISARYNNNYILAMVKYNSSGTIQWQRQLSAVASGWRITSPTDVQVGADGAPVFISAFVDTCSTSNRVLIAKIPSDGSKTGTYTLSGIPWVYATSTGTDADVTNATYTTSGFGSSAISLSATTTSYTASASGLTTGTVLL